MTEHGRGKGGGHQKVKQVAYTGPRSGGCTVGLGLGHGMTCADAGDGEACNLGVLGLLELWGIKGLYSLDTNIVGNQMKMSV